MKRSLTFLTLLACAAGSVFAEPESQPKDQRERGKRQSEFAKQFFTRLDTNEDHKIDEEEFAANPRLERANPEQRSTLFKRLDKNGNGVIERNELKPPKPMDRKGPPKWLRDGPVSFEKFARQPRVQKLSEEMQRRLFDRMDTNGDGVLSKEDSPRNRRDRRPPGERRPNGKLLFERLDEDKDGKISFPEFQNAPPHRSLGEDEAEDRFEALDENGDAVLSPEEFKSAPRKKEGGKRTE